MYTVENSTELLLDSFLQRAAMQWTDTKITKGLKIVQVKVHKSSTSAHLPFFESVRTDAHYLLIIFLCATDSDILLRYF